MIGRIRRTLFFATLAGSGSCGGILGVSSKLCGHAVRADVKGSEQRKLLQAIQAIAICSFSVESSTARSARDSGYSLMITPFSKKITPKGLLKLR